MLKIKCHIYGTLIPYCNGSWTYVSTRIESYNIGTPQDIAATTALASECEANVEPFPIHKLPNPPAMKKELANDVALMERAFGAPSYRTDTQPYHRMKWTIVKWIAADCLPYGIVETHTFRAMTRILDLKCPKFGRKAITAQVGHYP